LRARLELFGRVCGAVQHAHQKGVIHRDLKPSNILVASENGEPVPKVIDFGIAKATSVPLTDKMLHTQIDVLIGTPAYTSPEQMELGVRDVDTRADIYSPACCSSNCSRVAGLSIMRRCGVPVWTKFVGSSARSSRRDRRSA
jgi:serine/threonine protein kinase